MRGEVIRMKVKALTLALGCIISSSSAMATDWLTLQGLEKPKSEKKQKLWGFIQPEYSSTSGTDLKAGGWEGQEATFNQIGPDLDSSSTFNLKRARLGLRGKVGNDNKINYFLLSEFGNNGITKGLGNAKLTDASITLNHIPNAHIRVGQFKTPGAEEAMKAIHVFDYNNFTTVGNQILLERFFDEDGSRTGTTDNVANKQTGSVGAFRDIGVQVFNTFKTKKNWEHSYAVMLGNGNGINRGDNNSSKDLYLYASTEKVFGGKGAKRQGAKFFAWHQSGKRTLDFVNGVAGKQDFDRKRYGVGTTYRKGKLRLGGEYIKAEGMIFNGTDGGAVAGTLNNAGTQVASFNVLPNDEANGYYLDAGYQITPKLGLDLRYDSLSRGTNTTAGERKFTTTTLGGQYKLGKRTRLIANYEIRDAKAPNQVDTSAANTILGGMDNRASIQLLSVF